MSDIESQKNTIRKVVSVFGGVCMFCGAMTAAGTVWAYFYGEKSRNWPSVEGAVISSRIETHERVNSNQIGAVSYRPGIRYSYTLNNTNYTNNRVNFSPIGGGNRSPSQYYVSRFVVGNTYPVYYEKGSPENSTLIRGTSTLNIAGIFGGAVFFVFGLVMYKMKEIYANSIPDDSNKAV